MNSNAMKKNIIIAALALLGLAACQKETPSRNSISEPVFKLEVGIPQSGVKTALGDQEGNSCPLLWKEGDVICVNGVNSNALTAAQAGKANAEFTFAEAVSAPYSVVYPASAMSKEAETDFISISDTLSYQSGQFDASAAVMFGYGETAPVSIAMATSLVKVKVCRNAAELVKSITLLSCDGKALSGKFTYDVPSGALTPSTGINASTLISDPNFVWDADGSISAVFCIPAGEYPGGFLVGINTTTGETMSKAAYRKTGVTLASGRMLSMSSFNFSGSADFSGGKGTAENPYIISTVADLKQMAVLVNAGLAPYNTAVYSQSCDIENAALVDHIGTGSNPFSGVYNGNDHKITNITFSASTNEKGQGLFGTVSGEGAVIKNLVINGYTNASTQDRHGAFVGVLLSPATVESCKLEGTAVSFSGAQSGGIVGRASGDVTNCMVTANLSFTKAATGGVVGLSYDPSTVKDCSASCNITATAGGVGGVVGYDETSSGIQNCSYSGTLSGGAGNVGGILGYKSSRNGEISGCVVSGSVSGTKSVGGIMGTGNRDKKIILTISNCTNNADVTVSGTSVDDNIYAGGILGLFSVYGTDSAESSVTIQKCTNNGAITTCAKAGGIVGWLFAALTSSFVVEDCVNNGAVTGTNSYIGGVLGGSDLRTTGASTVVRNCKNTAAVSGVERVSGIAGSSYNQTGASPFSAINCENTGTITGSGINAGGIVGLVYSKIANTATLIDKCVNSGDIIGLANVGGILGYSNPEKATSLIKVINSICRDCSLTATGAPEGSNYIRLGGIVGGNSNVTDAYLYVHNCGTFNIKLKSTKTSGTSYAVGGIVGSTYRADINGVYSSIVGADVIFSTSGSTGYYGAVAGYMSTCTFANDYFDKSYRAGGKSGTGVSGTSITTAQFTDGTLLGNMNAAAATIEGAASWVADKSGYPVPQR